MSTADPNEPEGAAKQSRPRGSVLAALTWGVVTGIWAAGIWLLSGGSMLPGAWYLKLRMAEAVPVIAGVTAAGGLLGGLYVGLTRYPASLARRAAVGTYRWCIWRSRRRGDDSGHRCR